MHLIPKIAITSYLRVEGCRMRYPRGRSKASPRTRTSRRDALTLAAGRCKLVLPSGPVAASRFSYDRKTEIGMTSTIGRRIDRRVRLIVRESQRRGANRSRLKVLHRCKQTAELREEQRRGRREDAARWRKREPWRKRVTENGSRWCVTSRRSLTEGGREKGGVARGVEQLEGVSTRSKRG